MATNPDVADDSKAAKTATLQGGLLNGRVASVLSLNFEVKK